MSIPREIYFIVLLSAYAAIGIYVAMQEDVQENISVIGESIYETDY